MAKKITFIVFLGLFNSLVFSSESKELNETIVRFHENPAAVLNELPAKTPQVGDESMLDYMVSPFGQKPLDLGDLIVIKDQGRSIICKVKDGIRICATDDQGRAGILSNDRFENLVDENPNAIRTLEQMDTKNLLKAELSEQPWSDDYWAIANGILAHRYAHESGEKNHLWDQAWEKFKDAPTQELLDQGMAYALSPAEKYDLLVGDKNFTLTRAMFEEGRGYFERNGSVESWMGICHGWAPAAYMLPRPKKMVWVKSADGKYDIPFYPSDIKSLGSLLYAKNNSETKFVGGRCNTKDPQKDENGRVTDQNCFDNNPATWHFAMINQIGVNNRSMVMDATFDYEVWNQPILGYELRYFNPDKMTYENNLADATTKLGFFNKDKFKKYRDPKTKSIIGIEMKVKYIVETSPSHNQMDSAHYDGIKAVTYLYDLELDSNGNVIGGEWYSNAHPDFLWTPVKDSTVTTSTDQYLASLGVHTWNSETVVNPAISKFVNYESRRGSPLALIVNELFKSASGKNKKR